MLSNQIIKDVLHAALSTGGDFAEIFVDNTYTNNIESHDGIVKHLLSGEDFGIGIRIIKGTNSIYTYSNSSDREVLIRLAKSSAATLSGASKFDNLDLTHKPVVKNTTINLKPSDVAKKDKIDITKLLYTGAKEFDKAIQTVKTNYMDTTQNILIANSDGLLVEDERIRTRMMVQSVANVNGSLEMGYYAPGAGMGFDFYDNIDVEHYAKEASRIALTMATADFAPSGKMPVVINNEFGGVIFHEACGHGLETTSVAKGNSVFCDKIGEQVASPIVTAIDDGTIPNAWGTLNVDDEGTPTKRNVLIENGVLKSYLVDKLGGLRMGIESTGSGRRQSYKFAPTSRMNNTYIDNGTDKFEDIIKSVEYGLFAKYLGGGQVDTATGNFNFATQEAYLIENGEITKPVKGATLIGNGPETLHKIDMVGDNLSFGQGMCGSSSGSMPTDVGQPTIKVSEMTVGGRSGGNK